jgi:hypothetical protein
MRDAFATPAAPHLKVKVFGTDTLQRVEIIKDGLDLSEIYACYERKVSGDSGLYSDDNMVGLERRRIDNYVPDPHEAHES